MEVVLTFAITLVPMHVAVDVSRMLSSLQEALPRASALQDTLILALDVTVRKKKMKFNLIPNLAINLCATGNGGCSDFCNYDGPGERTCTCNVNARLVAGSLTTCECFPGYVVGAGGTCAGMSCSNKAIMRQCQLHYLYQQKAANLNFINTNFISNNANDYN